MPRILSLRDIYAGWTRLRMARVALDGGAIVEREVEDHGRAAAVLPYDPQRRVALLVTQPRIPALYMGETHPILEAPAGLIDADDPDEAARREALEECGVRLHALDHVACAWSMPGLSTERMDLYLAAYAAQDRVAAGGGVRHENEEIEVIEMTLADLAAMVDDGRLTDLKTLALVLALRGRQPALFQT